MMRHPSLFVLSTVWLVVATAFSQTGVSQEFPDKEQLGASNRSETRAAPMTNLERQIGIAGFDIINVHEGNVFEIQVTYEDWEFPVFLEMSPNQEVMWCTFVLQEFPGPLAQYAENFATLLSLGGVYGDVFFKFDPQSRMMVLVGSHENEQVQAEEIIGTLTLLASIAVEHKTHWIVSDASEPFESKR